MAAATTVDPCKHHIPRHPNTFNNLPVYLMKRQRKLSRRTLENALILTLQRSRKSQPRRQEGWR